VDIGQSPLTYLFCNADWLSVVFIAQTLIVGLQLWQSSCTNAAASVTLCLCRSLRLNLEIAIYLMGCCTAYQSTFNYDTRDYSDS